MKKILMVGAVMVAAGVVSIARGYYMPSTPPAFAQIFSKTTAPTEASVARVILPPEKSATIAAENVAAGYFGANTGVGNYNFPADVTLGSGAQFRTIAQSDFSGVSGPTGISKLTVHGGNNTTASPFFNDGGALVLTGGNAGSNALAAGGSVYIYGGDAANIPGYVRLGYTENGTARGGVVANQLSVGTNLSVGTTLTVAATAGIGTSLPQSKLEVAGGYLQASYVTQGAPPAADCTNNAQRGRIVLDSANFQLYVCTGSARGWDHAVLID